MHFDYIYRRESQYFVPFISKNYKDKIWTNHEVRTAIARAIENKEEYILPVKLDNTDLDGIRSTIGHLSNKSPEQIAEAIIMKLGAEPNIPLPEKEEPQGNVYLSVYVQASSEYGITDVNIGVTVTNTINSFRYFQGPYFKISKPILGNSDTFHLVDMMIPVVFPKRMEYGEQYQVMYNLKQGFFDSLQKLRDQEVTLTAYVMTTVGEKFQSNEMSIDDLFRFEG